MEKLKTVGFWVLCVALVVALVLSEFGLVPALVATFILIAILVPLFDWVKERPVGRTVEVVAGVVIFYLLAISGLEGGDFMVSLLLAEATVLVPLHMYINE